VVSDIVGDIIRFLITVAVLVAVAYLAVIYVAPHFSFASLGPAVRVEDVPEQTPPLVPVGETEAGAEAETEAGTEAAAQDPAVVYVEYVGDLELPVAGATGYAPTRLSVTATAGGSATSIGELAPGTAFLIISEDGDWWEISAKGLSGWVRHNLCMINLPDVIPSIVYNNTNASRSLFVTSGQAIPDITGEKLYDAYFYNRRLGRDEYIMPAMYAMAKKIYKAQKSAAAEGNTLVLYEAFRPYPVQVKVSRALRILAMGDKTVDAGINAAPWSVTWFISSGVSIHQEGCAIDVSLATVLEAEENYVGEYIYRKPVDYYEFTMPSPLHELSKRSVMLTRPINISDTGNSLAKHYSEGMKNSVGAQKLQTYCMDAGLLPLASEWWHFNDMETRNSLPLRGRGDFYITECYSAAPQLVAKNVPQD
jgi:D-alanyl-D-alanine dipeptidase